MKWPLFENRGKNKKISILVTGSQTHGHTGPGCKTLSTSEQSIVPEWRVFQMGIPELSQRNTGGRLLESQDVEKPLFNETMA